MARLPLVVLSQFDDQAGLEFLAHPPKSLGIAINVLTDEDSAAGGGLHVGTDIALVHRGCSDLTASCPQPHQVAAFIRGRVNVSSAQERRWNEQLGIRRLALVVPSQAAVLGIHAGHAFGCHDQILPLPVYFRDKW